VILQVSQIVFGLTPGVLGATPNRMGIWTQGCSLKKCQGCSSKNTWSPKGGKAVRVETILRLASTQSPPPSGLTISGGEPTDQAVCLAPLIEGFRHRFPGAEVVLYTGLCFSDFSKRFPLLLESIDVAITGPYLSNLEATPLAGSSNQEVKLLTPLAERLYRGWENWSRHPLQVGKTRRGEIVAVGIPHMPRMTHAAQKVGMTLTGTTGEARS